MMNTLILDINILISSLFLRLTDGESDSNQQPRGKTRPGRRGEKGAKGGRTRNEGVNGQRGKVGKRISPNVSD